MTQALDPSRRRALKFLSGVPMLLIATTLGGTSLLAACGGGDIGPITPPATFVSAKFSSMAAPSLANAAAMATTTVGSTLRHPAFRRQDAELQAGLSAVLHDRRHGADGKGGNVLAGGYYDINNQPIIDNTVAGKERHYSPIRPTAPRC